VWSAIIVAAGTIEEKVLDLSPSDTITKKYLRDIQHLEEQQITHELGIKGPFKTISFPKVARNPSLSKTPPSRNSSSVRIRRIDQQRRRFNQIYASLHHPRFASAMLKTSSADCPASVRARFWVSRQRVQELARPHVTTNRSIHRLSNTPSKMGFIFPSVMKMKLSKDRRSVQLKYSLTLAGIPPEAFEYRLG
jgi:hypothetical protein